MKLRTRVVLQLAALCFVLAAYSFAADNAHLYIVHGIPGRDIADNLNPGLPIDVLINGTCLARGLTFDNTSGPLSFSAGIYDVQIGHANTLAPCTNSPIIDSQVTLSSGASVSAVAAISGGKPTLLQQPVASSAGQCAFCLSSSGRCSCVASHADAVVCQGSSDVQRSRKCWQAAGDQRTGGHLSGAGCRRWQHDPGGIGADRLGRSVRHIYVCCWRGGQQLCRADQ